jgi:hypothetical protein
MSQVRTTVIKKEITNMLKRILAAAIVVAAPLANAQAPEAAATPKAAGPAPVVRISPERLEMLRRSMQAQLAAYDVAEGAMRQPTAAEAKSLTAGMTPGAERIVALPGGGAALRRDLSNLNFLVVDVSADGKKTMRHGSADSVNAVKGGQHAR